MSKEISKKINPPSKRSLTANEESSISHFKKKSSIKLEPIFCSSEKDGNEILDIVFDKNLEHQEAVDLLDCHLMRATGIADRKLGIRLLASVGQATLSAKASTKEAAEHLDTLSQLMQAFAPHDEYEGQLVAQLVVLHEHAMDLLGRAMRVERADFANIYLNGASKLLVRHHETLEALLKYRRKGEQRVYVEHVHIHGGGQAIVGNVTTGGVGMQPIIEEGPHAKV